MMTRRQKRNMEKPGTGENAIGNDGNNDVDDFDAFAKVLQKAADDGDEPTARQTWVSLLNGSDEEENLKGMIKLAEEVILSSSETSKRASISKAMAGAFVDAVWFCSNQSFVEKEASGAKPSDAVPGPIWLRLIHDLAKKSDVVKNMWIECVDAAWLAPGKPSATADWQKKLRLVNTQLYYRQQKFNLLAEESEGYAKLLHRLVRQPQGTGNSKNYEDIQAMIGTFHLDPNRCLDLILDVLVNDFQEQIGATQTGSPKNPLEDITTRQKDLLGMIRSCLDTGKVAVLLGFKWRDGLDQLEAKQQQQQQATPSVDSGAGTNDPTSRKTYQKALLFCMTWLVVHNVLQVSDMIMYLPEWRKDLSTTYSECTSKEKERVKALGKVRLLSSSSKKQEKDEFNPKQFVQSFYDSSLMMQWIRIFCQFKQWFVLYQQLQDEQMWRELCVLFPQTVGSAICEWIQEQLTRLSTRIREQLPIMPWLDNRKAEKTIQDTEATEEAPMDIDEIGSSKAHLTPSQYEAVLRDLVSTLPPILSIIHESGCIVYKPIVFTQLCRLLQSLLMQPKKDQPLGGDTIEPEYKIDDGNDLMDDLVDLIDSFLLPSLSVLPSHASYSFEVGKVMECFPYETRYHIYSSWRGVGLERASLEESSSSDFPEKPLWLIEGELRAGKDTRYALRRLSKDTIRDTSRAIGKVCHSHPLVVFTTILNQIESYDNLVQVMVDALRFVTPLSLDVLAFCILCRVSGQSATNASMVDRSRLKEDGLNVSQWLQSLEAFVGAFHKRYPTIEFRGLLGFLTHRLTKGEVMELGILRSLLKTAGGWAFADYAPASSLSHNQLEGQAGSALLKRETMSFGVVEDYSRSASRQVRRVFYRDNIGMSLLILLTQVRNEIVFQDDKPSASAGWRKSNKQPRPVKLIGNLYDTCQVVSSILLDFLTSARNDASASVDSSTPSIQVDETILQYAKSMPSLSELCNVYKLETAYAWMLCRPLVRAAMMGSQENDEIRTKASELMGKDPLEQFRPNESMRKSYASMLPEKAWQDFTPVLFETFFCYALYDLSFPDEVYGNEIARLDKEVDRLSRQQAGHGHHLEVSTGTGGGFTAVEELERAKRVAADLSFDRTRHRRHVEAVKKLIEGKKKEMFLGCVDEKVEVPMTSSASFLQHCIYPRCMQGPDDAMYCARFVSLLHAMRTPGFGTLHYYDCAILALSRTVFGLTEGEAANLSILLYHAWKSVSRWRYDPKAFQDEIVGTPGSYFPIESDPTTGVSKWAPINEKEYHGLYNKWHAALGAALLGCLELSSNEGSGFRGRGEYMHKRNGLIILSRLVEVFPTRPGLANKLLAALEPLQDDQSPYADIRATAGSYKTQLIKARDDGVWKEEDAATVQKRMKQEQEAAVERQKKAEKQMEQMKLDSEKITEEIGEKDWDRPWHRRQGFGPATFEGGGASREERHDGRARNPPPTAPRDSSWSSHGPPPPPPRRDHWEHEPPSRGLEGRWRDPSRGGLPGSNVPGGGGPSGNNPGGGPRQRSSAPSVSGPPSSGGGGASSPATSGKRSRPSSPVEQGESRDEPRQSKRARPADPDEPRGGDRGSRRSDRRRPRK